MLYSSTVFRKFWSDRALSQLRSLCSLAPLKPRPRTLCHSASVCRWVPNRWVPLGVLGMPFLKILDFFKTWIWVWIFLDLSRSG